MVRVALRALSLLAVAACAEPDPPYGDPGGILGKTLPNQAATDTSSGGSSNGPFPAAYDANANKPTTTAVAAHQAAASKGAPTNTTSSPLTCGDCHKAGGAATDKAFAFGGRVMRAAAGAANVDVIITGPTTLGPVKTDADGFFWLLGSPIGAGAKATIRNASGMSAMNGTPGASCDTTNCHQDGAQGRIGKGLP